jgi:hypothetical protein
MAASIAQTVLGNPSAFASMISQMLSPQNEQRQAAEALFTEVKKNADATTTNLLTLLRQSPDHESRAFCAVMLRKVSAHLETSVQPSQDAPVHLASILFSAHLQVLTKDDPSLWPQCTPSVQVTTAG